MEEKCLCCQIVISKCECGRTLTLDGLEYMKAQLTTLKAEKEEWEQVAHVLAKAIRTDRYFIQAEKSYQALCDKQGDG